MRQFRVGTFSMGILLIAVGVLLLLGRFAGISSIKLILDFWPVILIILGIEILTYVFVSKEDQPKIKYDGLSIFIIILLIFLSTIAYAGTTILEKYPYIIK